MITKFNTGSISNVGSSTNAKGSSNTLLYVVIGAIAIYLGYKYVIKPQTDRQEAEKNQ